MQVSQLEIATNTLEVINVLHSKDTLNNSLVLSCRDLFLSLRNPQMKHEPRQANGVADHLAKEGLKLPQNKLFVVWITPPPSVKKFWKLLQLVHLL